MEKDVYVKIGERLRKQRRIMGLTQEQAAELLEYRPPIMGEIERGKPQTDNSADSDRL